MSFITSALTNSKMMFTTAGLTLWSYFSAKPETVKAPCKTCKGSGQFVYKNGKKSPCYKCSAPSKPAAPVKEKKVCRACKGSGIFTHKNGIKSICKLCYKIKKNTCYTCKGTKRDPHVSCMIDPPCSYCNGYGGITRVHQHFCGSELDTERVKCPMCKGHGRTMCKGIGTDTHKMCGSGRDCCLTCHNVGEIITVVRKSYGLN